MKNFLLLLVTIFYIGNLNAQTKSSEITGLSAKLFYNQNKETSSMNVSGTFSDNVIDNENYVLWNAIIGGGSAEGYSHQTIVIVTVKSIGLSNVEQKIKLTAKADGKNILSETKDFSCIGDKAEHKILFLLNDTGCDELALKVELINGGKTVSAMSRDIKFQCGE